MNLHFVNKKTKKILLVFFSIFSLILVVFGSFYYAVVNYMKKKGKEADSYVRDLIKYNIVVDEKELKHAVFYYERKSFYEASKWSFRIIILFTTLSFSLIFIFFNGDIKGFFGKITSFIPIFKWPLIEEANQIIIEKNTCFSLPNWMIASIIPTIIFKKVDFTNAMLYFSLLYYIAMIVCLIKIMVALFCFIAHYFKVKKIMKQMAEDQSLVEINNYSTFLNSAIPNQEKYL